MSLIICLLVLHKIAFEDLDADIIKKVVDYIKPNMRTAELRDFINSQTHQGFTPLHYASFRGNINTIKALIAFDADYTILNNKNLSVIHLAAQGNQPNSLCYFKEEWKMSVEEKDSLDSSPLNWACYSGSETVVKYLLSWNVNINAQDKEGLTPLHLSVIANNDRIIRLLLHNGADKNIRNNNGQTPYDLAVKHKKIDVIDLLVEKSCEVCRLKAPLKKIEKSKTNIFGFFIINLVIFFFTFMFFLQILEEKKIEYVYYVLILMEFFIYLLLLNSSSVRSDIKIIKSSFSMLIEQNRLLENYCPTCVIEMDDTTKHCFICNVCVDNFNHHCYWINKCVGKSNYELFIIFLFWTCCYVGYNLYIQITSKFYH